MKRIIEKTVIYHDVEKINPVYDGGDTYKKSKWDSFYDWTNSIIAAVIVIFLLFTFLFRPVSVSGRSMLPTLKNGDWLIVNHINYEPEYGDIVVVTKAREYDEPIIKRVIGLPGDIIDIDFTSGIVYRNGEKLEENYLNTPTNLSYDMKFPLTVPEKKVFVMGDNRNDSLDSRSSTIGFVDKRYILGKATARVFPITKFKIFN